VRANVGFVGALKQEWRGRVFLNPPYSTSFIEKLIDEARTRRVTEFVLLTSNASDAGWFQKAAAFATSICFPARRIKFISPHGLSRGPAQGQALFHRGGERFAIVFGTIGRIVAGGRS
jgi:DNA N-6-adenine-methyltransferase (Dam)